MYDCLYIFNQKAKYIKDDRLIALAAACVYVSVYV